MGSPPVVDRVAFGHGGDKWQRGDTCGPRLGRPGDVNNCRAFIHIKHNMWRTYSCDLSNSLLTAYWCLVSSPNIFIQKGWLRQTFVDPLFLCCLQKYWIIIILNTMFKKTWHFDKLFGWWILMRKFYIWMSLDFFGLTFTAYSKNRKVINPSTQCSL